jgi:hypothetical protein
MIELARVLFTSVTYAPPSEAVRGWLLRTPNGDQPISVQLQPASVPPSSQKQTWVAAANKFLEGIQLEDLSVENLRLNFNIPAGDKIVGGGTRVSLLFTRGDPDHKLLSSKVDAALRRVAAAKRAHADAAANILAAAKAKAASEAEVAVVAPAAAKAKAASEAEVAVVAPAAAEAKAAAEVSEAAAARDMAGKALITLRVSLKCRLYVLGCIFDDKNPGHEGSLLNQILDYIKKGLQHLAQDDGSGLWGSDTVDARRAVLAGECIGWAGQDGVDIPAADLHRCLALLLGHPEYAPLNSKQVVALGEELSEGSGAGGGAGAAVQKLKPDEAAIAWLERYIAQVPIEPGVSAKEAIVWLEEDLQKGSVVPSGGVSASKA